MVSTQVIADLPKVALHDHLDGGLRPQTVVELAADIGHELPATDPQELADWFFDHANAGSLHQYLTTFEHTLAVMQRPEHLLRVAREFVLDQAADNVVYAETRWAPEQHTRAGMSLVEAVSAVRDGLAQGMAEAAANGRPVVVQQILTTLRHNQPRREVADLAVMFRNDSVCGFDLAGDEANYPSSGHEEMFRYLRSRLVPLTIHAGEAAGVDSIAHAVGSCGATRLGHGVRIVDDIAVSGSGFTLGEVASYVCDRRIALEVCPTSNVQTGVCASIEEHPVGILIDAGLRVAISCDNRLMSRTTLTRELSLVADAFGLGIVDLWRITRDAMRSAFFPYDSRERLLDRVIDPAYRAALSER